MTRSRRPRAALRPRAVLLPGAALAAAAALTLAAPAAAQDDTTRATARMQLADGAPAGTVEFTGGPNGVLVEVLLVGLTPGEHAIHLHETGSCAPDFQAAGGHFAPHGKAHGFLNPDGPHAGDLPNIFVTVEGAATAQFFNERVMLDAGEAALLDEDGTAVIVHELPDVHGDPSGTGARIACGVLEPLI